jgi:phosphoribosyl-AMP cyclohydrolase / phosphoribosyl-ATP pyrophosphohydrolase
MNVLCNADAMDWAKGGGLLPAIVQDARSLRVLMLGYMSRHSLQQTFDTGLVTFFSRSRQRLWQKGEMSGHVLHVREISPDCDRDAFLILADPAGPTCHLGSQSCFGDEGGPNLSTIAALADTIRARHLSPRPDSYTSKLFAQGVTRIAQKVGEEAVEAALAAATGSPTLAAESADLLYHLLVLLEARETDWMGVIAILRERAAAKPG